MREKITFRAAGSSKLDVEKTTSAEELLQGKKLCSICYDYKDNIIDWNCKRGCIFEFCKDCKKEISLCPLCKEPYGLFKDSTDIPEDLQIFLASDYSLVPGPRFPNKITIGTRTFYMSIQDYKPKNISPLEKESLGPIWTKIILGNHTAYESMIKLGAGKGLKLDIYEDWNDELETGSFKIGITKISQENKVNTERSHSFNGNDEEKSVYMTYESFGSPSPSSSRKRNADEPPPVILTSQKAVRNNNNSGPRRVSF
jgi:hypothetical protein